MTNIGTGFAMDKQDIDIKEIRELAKKFTPEEIETCIKQQLEAGTNVCEVTGPTEYVIGELAKAQVRQRINGERHVHY